MRVYEVLATFLRGGCGATSHQRLWTDGWRLFSYGRLIAWYDGIPRRRVAVRTSRNDPVAVERHKLKLIDMNGGEYPIEMRPPVDKWGYEVTDG